jgi:hypothetical protein
VLILGGGNPATATTELIDLSAATPQWVFGPSMSQPRIEMNATILPNGQVVALGGSVNDEDGSTASFNTDIYDPPTNTFTTGAPNAFPRLYHSNSLLLPDATVMVAGSNPGRGAYEQNSEIYSPPYLFNADGSLATRPAITSVTPATFTYGGAFQVQTPDAGSISSVVLLRPGAATHAFDMEQRFVELSFTAGSGVLNVTAPPNGSIAPPGYYMVFILNSAGVPSAASFVQLSTLASAPPSPAITKSATNATSNSGQSVSFAAAGRSNPATRTVSVTDFSLSTMSASQMVLPSGSARYTVTVAVRPGFKGVVALTVSGLPPGARASFTPSSVTGSGTSMMKVTTPMTTLIGSYPLTITGSSGGVSHSTSVTLNAAVPPL